MDSHPSPDGLVERLRALGERASAALLRLVVRLTPTEQQRVFSVTLLVGGVCGLVAVAFHLAIRLCETQLVDRAASLPGDAWVAGIVLLPAVGGLAAGAALKHVPKARGSGIPFVKAAYAIKSDKLRLRDAAAKFAVSALQIGSGASLGREGPTVQICATVATAVGRVFALSPSNQRRLIPVGAAAGIAAAFNAPLAAVTFVIEELVGGLDTTVLSGVVIAAALAAVAEHAIDGEQPVFTVPGAYGLEHSSSLLVYAALGVAAGLLGHAFVRALLRLRALFRASGRVPSVVQPAIGGLVTGSLAASALLVVHQRGVTGGGYDTLAAALHGRVALDAMIVLCFAKWGATVSSYASGGAGGIFAPSLFIGGMLGGLFGHLDQWVLGHGDAQVGAFALVGMGAFFAAVIRAPITSVLIIFEMTRSYRLVLPLMIANTVAYLLSRRGQKLPIYEALLEQDGVALPRASSPLLATFLVRDAMTMEVVSVRSEMTVEDALDATRTHAFGSFPVVDTDGRLLGVATEGRLRRLVAEGERNAKVGDHVHRREFLHTGQTLRDALDVMNRLSLRQMLVVEKQRRDRLAGILSMSDVMRALLDREPPPESMSATATPRPAA